ncbi:MAG: metal ABC transporter substrate-binding protein [Promethearchaeota archaeon]
MKKKKNVAIAVILILLSLAITIQQINNIQGKQLKIPSTSTEVNVAATTTTLADFVGFIINSEVEPIINPGSCPAHYDSEPSDLELIQEADIVFCHSFEGQWLDDLLSSAGKIGAKYAINPLVNSLPWGVPANAKQYLRVITAKLNTTYPDQATQFNTQLSLYETQIDEKASNLQESAELYGLVDKKAVVMFHQIGFCNFLGLDVVGNWSKSDELMSVQDVADLITLAQSTGAELVVSNLQSGTNVGEEVSNELNIPHAILTNFPQGCPGTDTYLDMLDYNLEQLNLAINSTKKAGLSLLGGIVGLVVTIAILPIIRRKARRT